MVLKNQILYFQDRIIIIHDNFYIFSSYFSDQEILNELESKNFLVWTPSRRINGRRIVCYDDRYILNTAVDEDGIIVSNDNFRDIQNEKPEWKKVIEERLLMYSFVSDR